MKRVIHCVLLTLLASCGDDAPPEDLGVDVDGPVVVDRRVSLLSSPWKVGFGANTTGAGMDGALYTVTNTNDSGPGSLREGLQTPNTWVVYDPSLDGQTIYIEASLRPARDVTWDGRDALVRISTRGIPVERKSLIELRNGNAIVHRVLWGPDEDLSGRDTNLLDGMEIERGENYWIDHCETRFTDSDSLDVGDTSAQGAINVSITHYKVYDARAGLRISQDTKSAQDANRDCCVTIAYSDLSAICRNFLHSGGNFSHGFNNYVHDFGGDPCGNVVGHSEAEFRDGIKTPIMLVESTVYNDGNVALRARLEGLASIPGLPVQAYAYTNGLNLFLREARQSEFVIDPGQPDPGPGRPVPPYAYELIPTEEVEGYVVANAGIDGANIQYP